MCHVHDVDRSIDQDRDVARERAASPGWHIIVNDAILPAVVESGANMYEASRAEGDEVLFVEQALLGNPDQLAFSVAAMTEGPDEDGAEQAFDVCPDVEEEGVHTFTSEEFGTDGAICRGQVSQRHGPATPRVQDLEGVHELHAIAKSEPS